MTFKPVVPCAAARADVDNTIDHYLAEAGPEVALGVIDALERAYAAIGEVPGIGSPRWPHELNLPGLRPWRIQGYPWLVLYVEAEISIDVWRVLHAKRDITAWMEGEDPEAPV